METSRKWFMSCAIAWPARRCRHRKNARRRKHAKSHHHHAVALHTSLASPVIGEISRSSAWTHGGRHANAATEAWPLAARMHASSRCFVDRGLCAASATTAVCAAATGAAGVHPGRPRQLAAAGLVEALSRSAAPSPDDAGHARLAGSRASSSTLYRRAARGRSTSRTAQSTGARLSGTVLCMRR